MEDQWVARVEEEFMKRHITLRLAANGSGSGHYLMPDGNFKTVNEGEIADDGLVLPNSSARAILKAFQDYVGIVSPSSQENKVLREWLDLEKERVDKILNAKIVSGNAI